jgi:hypothetical protein
VREVVDEQPERATTIRMANMHVITEILEIWRRKFWYDPPVQDLTLLQLILVEPLLAL